MPPQLDALDAGTDLVTIGLGGNDYGLFGDARGPVRRGSPPATPTGPRAATPLTAGGRDRLTESSRGSGTTSPASSPGSGSASPHARVLVVGYPQIAPESGTCDLLPLAAGDYAFARTVNQGLDDALSAGAPGRRRAEYVDLWKPSAGHDICSDDPWINGRVTSGPAGAGLPPARRRAAGRRRPDRWTELG